MRWLVEICKVYWVDCQNQLEWGLVVRHRFTFYLPGLFAQIAQGTDKCWSGIFVGLQI